MSNQSTNNDGEKREPSGKSFPINLAAAKVAVKSPDGSKSSLILGTQSLRALNQPHMRVLTHAVNPSSSSIPTTSPGPTIISTIVSQTMLKQGCHVPCGPAAVANIAVPRGATPIRGITVNQQGTVRQLAPPRTPSPGNVIQAGTTWPAGTTLQVQSAGQVGVASGTKTVGQNPLLVTQSRGITTTLPIMQSRANIARNQQLTGATSRPTTAVLHSAVGTPVGTAQIQTYKPVQSLGSALTMSQVGASKPVGGQTLVYTTVTTGQHLPQTQRLNVTTTPRQLTTNRTVSIPTTNTPTARLTQGGATVLAPGTRLAVVVSNTSQPQQLTFSGTGTSSTTGTAKVIAHPNHHGGTSIQIAQVQSTQPQTAGSVAAAKLTAQLQQHQANVVAAGNVTPTATVLPVTVTVTPTSRTASITGQPLRFGQIYVERSGFATAADATTLLQSPSDQQVQQMQIQTVGKQTSSPRPSILRKRENTDNSTLKAAKNLTPVLATLSATCLPPVSPPSRPDSRGTGQSSAGSTTISATSSPGPDESPSPPTTVNPSSLHSRDEREGEDSRPPIEMSPRKKPRKQQLTGNDLQEPKFDIQFLSDRVKECIEPKRPIPRTPTEVTVKKPVPASLLNSYHQTWKSTHNHFVRYTDVKPKEERQPSIVDIANQKRILQKIKGWKIYHLTAQMEDLSDFEIQVHSKLSNMLKILESKDTTGRNKDLDRINDLIKGNMQRSKIINDGMLDAKVQVMKIFDHKAHAADIISRCASKRNYKKREKS